MSAANTYIVACFGLIFNENGGVLLCLRNDMDLWNLPGGRMEKGEVPEECVIREIKEETGLDVIVKRFAGVYAKPDKNEIVFSFVCDIVGGSMRLTDESKDIQFFAIDNLPKNTSPKQVIRIQDALSHPTETLLMTHTGKSSRELLAEGKL